MIPKPLSEITIDDIQRLIDNEFIENRTLEYKQTVDLSTSGNKKEFLADVTAFANTIGGDLIIGVKEKEHLPKAINWLDVPDVDFFIRRIADILTSNTDPTMTSFDIREIKHETEDKYIFIIRVNKSYNAPHRISLHESSRFYGRSTGKKYIMDTAELRRTFLLSETVVEKIRAFKKQRIESIKNNDSLSICLPSQEKVILHLIPYNFFEPGQMCDIKRMSQVAENISCLSNFGYGGNRLNLDGLLLFDKRFTSKKTFEAVSYTQIFRGGAIEAVNTSFINEMPDEGPLYFIHREFESQVRYALSQYLIVLQRLKVYTPFYLFLTLINVKGLVMCFDSPSGLDVVPHSVPLDRNYVEFPEIEINEKNIRKADKILQPMFDIMWNAFGLPHSQNFTKKGRWRH